MAAFRVLWVKQTTHKEAALPAGIGITNTGHTAAEIGALARKCKNRAEARCLREIARRARVDGQTLCDRVNRYDAEGPDGLKDRPGRGRPSRPSEARRAEVGRWLDAGPEDGGVDPGQDQAFPWHLDVLGGGSPPDAGAGFPACFAAAPSSRGRSAAAGGIPP